MKKLALLCFLLTAKFYALHAQVPQLFNYQAIARDAARQPLAGAALVVKITILRGGAPIYSEEQNVTTAATGLFTVQVGSGNTAQFQAIDWSDGPLSLQTDVSGAAEISVPATPLVAVPYALLAADVINAPTVEASDPIIGEGTSSAPLQLAPGSANGQVLKWNGSAWGAGTDDTGGTGSTIGGDLSGPLSNVQINPGTIGSTELASMGASLNQVLQWNGSTWAPANVNIGTTVVATDATLIGDGTVTSPLQISPQGASAGQVLKWNGTSWVPSQDNSTSGSAGAVAVGPTLIGDGTSGTPLNLAQQGATLNQVLKWNGTTWAPGNDLTVTVIAAGDITGPFNNLQIANNTVGTDEVSNGSIAAVDLNSMGATTGQVLQWNGSAWVPSTLTGGSGQTTVSVNTSGLSITGTSSTGYTITNTGILTNTTAAGDASGTFSALSVNRLRGNNISSNAPTTNQVLKWNGTAWAPAADDTGSGSSPWVTDATGINYSGGTAKVQTGPSSGKLVEMGTSALLAPTLPMSTTTGAVATYDQNSKTKSILWHVSGNPTYGAVSVFGPNGVTGYPPVMFYADPNSNGGGAMYLSKANGLSVNDIRVAAAITDNDAGYLALIGPSGNNIAQLGGFSTAPNAGYLILPNPINITNRSAELSVDASNHGQLVLNNSNNSQNIYQGFTASGVGHIDVTGTGGYIVVNGAKYFRAPHPKDSTKEIWYACIEGPEAGMYERGTAKLTNGEAWVPFAEHFSVLLADNSLTVTLTPHSADTYGLAIVEKTNTGIRVKELKNGTGDFSFDWEVKGVRKGFEDYQAVRPKPRETPISKTSPFNKPQ